jgi:hypothetical protein
LLVSGPHFQDKFINITQTDCEPLNVPPKSVCSPHAVAPYVVGHSDSGTTDTGKTSAAAGGSSTTGSGSSQGTGDDSSTPQGSTAEGEDLGLGTRAKATYSLKNRISGVHCDANACRRGGGTCKMGSNGQCEYKNLRGEDAPVACLECICTRDG